MQLIRLRSTSHHLALVVALLYMLLFKQQAKEVKLHAATSLRPLLHQILTYSSALRTYNVHILAFTPAIKSVHVLPLHEWTLVFARIKWTAITVKEQSPYSKH